MSSGSAAVRICLGGNYPYVLILSSLSIFSLPLHPSFPFPSSHYLPPQTPLSRLPPGLVIHPRDCFCQSFVILIRGFDIGVERDSEC